MCDGIGYDVEIGGLGQGPFAKARETNFGILFQESAEQFMRAFGKHALVTYATAGFTKDGVTSTNNLHLAIMPFRHALLAPNIVARPMAYDGSERDHPKIVKCALGEVKLHPGQIQIGCRTASTAGLGISGDLTPGEIAKRCREIYAPNRVGLITFGATATSDITDFADFDKAANPSGPPRGTVGQPVQVPIAGP